MCYTAHMHPRYVPQNLLIGAIFCLAVLLILAVIEIVKAL